jgi:hypothetical protein
MRLSIFGLISAALTFATATWERARVAVDWVVGFVFDVLAQPFDFAARFPRAAVAAGPAFAYDGPPIHSLRHEAGTAQRAAARHV